MLIPILWFIVGLVLLIKGGDWFVDGASGIARKFHLPELLIGATIVSIGTTLPEVMVSAESAIVGHGEIAYGNAIGSVICNTSLIAALTVAVTPSVVERKSLKVPVIFFFLAAAFYCFNAYVTGTFSRTAGIISLGIFLVYMCLQIREAIQDKEEADDEDHEQCGTAEDLANEPLPEAGSPMWRNLLLLVVGAVLIAEGADLLVDNGTLIAQGLGVPESVIALTLVALGTSLPELVTAVTSIVKGCSDLSLGNIIGANLFNLTLVNGAAVTLCPFDVPASKYIVGMNSSLILDIPLMLFVMLLLTVPALIRGKLGRWQGVILLCVYAAFCGVQFFG